MAASSSVPTSDRASPELVCFVGGTTVPMKALARPSVPPDLGQLDPGW